MKKLLALLTAAVATLTSAWAAVAYTEESGYSDFSYSTIYTWHETSAAFHAGKVASLQADGVTEDTEYNHTNDNTPATTWKWWAENQGNIYAAPGRVLRLSDTTAVKTVTCDFSPFNPGGLIVEAEGYSFPANPSNKPDRGTTFGDPTGNQETWIKIMKSFTIARGSNNTSWYNGFYGTVNLFVDDAAVFDFASNRSDPLLLRTSSSKNSAIQTCLKMHGAGTMKVATLTATGNVTLDYSDLEKDHVFITGNIAVDNATVLRLPTGVDAGDTYQLCSGTITAENSVVPNKTIYVGEETIENATVTYSGNTVSYTTVANTSEATISGTSTLSALSWSNPITSGVVATITLEGDSKLALDDSLASIGLLTINGSHELVITTPTLWDSSKINIDDFTGKLIFEYDATSSLTIDGDAATAIRTSTNTYRFLGSEGNGVTLNMGCPNAAIHSHLIFQGGTHSLTHGYTVTGSDSNKFGIGATDDNPTVLVTGGATLNFNARDISYWEGAFSNDGVIRVNDGATLNLVDQGNNTMYYRQRFYFEPGATITVSNAIKNGAPVFRLIGGINASSEQIFIPENTSGEEKVVTLTGNIRMPTDTTQGFAMNIGANSKLKIVGAITAAGNYDICKRGAGELEVTGGIATARIYGAGKITVPADTSIVAHPTSNTANSHPTILGSGKVILPALAENTPRLTMDDSWTGTVEIPALQQDGTRTYLHFNNWGNANSTIVMKGLTGTSIWMQAGTTINPTVQLDGAVTINNGGSNSTYTFDKITGTGNLTVSSWADCKYGLTYNFNTIKNYSGTLTAQNASNNCAFTLGIGDIVTENEPTYGDKVLSLTRTCTAANKTLNYDVSATKLNGVATDLALKDDGIYVAAVKIGDIPYASLDEAIAGLGEEQDITAITLIDSSITTLPEGYEEYKIENGVIVARTYVAQVGEKKYETYAAAKSDCTGTETIVIIGDVDLGKFAKASEHANVGAIEIAENVTVKGFFPDGGETLPLIINGTFWVRDGYTTDAAHPNNTAVVPVLSGNGVIKENITTSATPTVKIEDYTGWKGVFTETHGGRLTLKFSVAKSDSAYYYSAEEAIAAVEGGTEVTNISLTDADLGEKYTIDESGKIVLAMTPAQKFVEEVATAEDGATIKVLESITLDAKLEISGKEITIDADSAVTITGQLRAVNGATLTIGANVTVTSDKHPTLFILGDPAVKTAGTKKTTVIVNGSILNTNEKFDETYAISGNGTDTQGVDLTINGTVCNSNGTAIYWPNKGSLVVNVGSTITGAAYGIYAKSGSVTIKGGTITSTATEIVDPSVNNNGTSGKGYALVLEKLAPGEGGYADYLTCNITGGTFEGVTAILSWARTSSIRLTKFVADGVTLTETTPSAADIKKSYVEPSTDLPGAEEVPADQKTAYNEWAEKNGVTESTTTDTKVLATAFAMGVTVSEAYPTIEAAAAKAVEDEVPAIDMAELVDGDLEAAVAAIQAKYGDKVTVELVEAEELTSTETSKFFKLSITIKK